MNKEFSNFKEFYPFYLSQHEDKTCRILHVIGTTIVLALFFTGIIHFNPRIWIFIPLAGYGFAWIGHAFFEKNKPATFKHPLWSLRGDFQMYFDILSGRISLNSEED